MNKIAEEENKKNIRNYFMWIVNKRNYFFYLLIGVLLLNVLIFKVKPLIIKKSPEETFLTNRYYIDWKQSFYKDNEKLAKLKSCIKKCPSLRPNYEGLILQNLLINENFSKEEYTLAETSLERTKAELPLYHEFSTITLLINNGQFQDALSKSLELKTKMLNDLTFLKEESLPAGSVLYSFNLLRIALLEGKLKEIAKELVAWQELENYLNLKCPDSVNDKIKIATKTLGEMFNEHGIELTDYIQYRKNAISPIKF